MNNDKPPLGIPIVLPLLLFLLLLAMLPFVFGQLFTVALIKLKLDPTRLLPSPSSPPIWPKTMPATAD